MKLKVSDDKELVATVLAALKKNDGYCPCVLNSKGNEQYKCPCYDCRINVAVGEFCHCGLYQKAQ